MAQESRELDALVLRQQQQQQQRQQRGGGNAPRMTPDFVIDVSRWARDNQHNCSCL